MSYLITSNFKYGSILPLLQRTQFLQSVIKSLSNSYVYHAASKNKSRFDKLGILQNNKLRSQGFSLSQSCNIFFFKSIKEDGFFKKFWKKTIYIVFMRQDIENRGKILYTKIEPKVDLQKFFEVCQLPDTFYSWYVVTELHVWLLCARMTAEGEDGVVVRNALLASLWMEVEERSKKLEGANPSARKEQAQEIMDQYLDSFLSYDEALNGDDRVLASALWRIIFAKECQDPELIECCINYIRKNLNHLEKIPFGAFLYQGDFSFLPLLEPSQLRTR